MSNKTILNLDKKKKHLAIIFSIIAFSILFLLQIFFFIFKYVEYHNDIATRLLEDYKRITGMRNFVDLQIPKFQENRNMPMGDKWKRFKASDFFVYDYSSSKIVQSNNSDIEFNLELLKNTKEYWFVEQDLWNEEYYIFRKQIDEDKDIFIYIEWNMSFSSVFFDLLKFFILSAIFSWLIYFLINIFINRLFKPVEDNIEEMEDFVHNVGHELKTPLANMKSSLELAKLKWDYTDCSIDTFSEIEKMNNLIDSLLTLSNLDNKKMETTFIFPLLEEEIKKYDFKIKEKNIKVSNLKNFDTKLNINSEHFKILFSNLLSNAIKYNKDNWNIDIILNEKYLSIKDTWIWIDNWNKDRIFEKFFREEFARSENGFGIWLSLVKKIVDLYSWKIEMKWEKWVWTEFIIKF